jgi:hypothetical protein
MSTQTPWSFSSKNGSGGPGWLSEKLSCLRRANLFWRALSIFLASMRTSWADVCTSWSNKADTVRIERPSRNLHKNTKKESVKKSGMNDEQAKKKKKIC